MYTVWFRVVATYPIWPPAVAINQVWSPAVAIYSFWSLVVAIHIPILITCCNIPFLIPYCYNTVLFISCCYNIPSLIPYCYNIHLFISCCCICPVWPLAVAIYSVWFFCCCNTPLLISCWYNILLLISYFFNAPGYIRCGKGVTVHGSKAWDKKIFTNCFVLASFKLYGQRIPRRKWQTFVILTKAGVCSNQTVLLTGHLSCFYGDA